MQTRMQKWGNGLGLRIPKSIAVAVGVEAGSEVELTLRDGDLRVRPTQARRVTLAALLRRVTTANCHDAIEIDHGGHPGAGRSRPRR